jgi:cofilin
MAASGVSVQDEVVNQFNNIKLKHKYRYIQLKLTDDWKEIEVEKTVETSTYPEFIEQLPKGDCRYAVYDFQFDVGDAGQREQLIFIVWCPEESKVKTKMLYAASKDALRKKLVGINHEVQATESSELAERDIIEKLKSKMVK